MLTALELQEGRILDTRVDGDRQPFSGERVVGPIPGGSGHPAAEVTLTATDAAGRGFITAWASGPRPTTSCLNFARSGDEDDEPAAIANTTTVRLAPDGTFRVFSPVPTHLVVDLVGLWHP